MVKEVSDKIVIFLVVLAVIISILGTYLVYYNANYIEESTPSQDQVQPEQQLENAQVGVLVISEEGEGNG